MMLHCAKDEHSKGSVSRWGSIVTEARYGRLLLKPPECLRSGYQCLTTRVGSMILIHSSHCSPIVPARCSVKRATVSKLLRLCFTVSFKNPCFVANYLCIVFSSDFDVSPLLSPRQDLYHKLLYDQERIVTNYVYQC